MKTPCFKQLQAKIKSIFDQEEPGHDYFHLERVLRNATSIYQEEGGDWDLIEAACWCHDLGDDKLGHDLSPSDYIRSVLQECRADEAFISKTIQIVESVSFHGGQNHQLPETLEAKIVQDADRLDALGAIGIARCFSYSGRKGTRLYHPDEQPQAYSNVGAYRSSKSSAVMHFYEKLFLLKDRMNTLKGKQLAAERHQYMEGFLQQFFREWGKE